MSKKRSSEVEDLISGRKLFDPLDPQPESSTPEQTEAATPTQTETESKEEKSKPIGRPPAIEDPVKLAVFISKEARLAIVGIQAYFQAQGEPGTMSYAVDAAILDFAERVKTYQDK